MKQFIYLDTDIVSSIIAQSEKGFIMQQTIEIGNKSDQLKDNTLSAGAKAGGAGGLWKFFQVEANMSVSGESHSGYISQSSAREIVEKTLHDAAFDLAYSYITPSLVEPGNQDYDEEGNYLEVKRYFDYVDFDYLEGLFVKDGVIDFLKKTSFEQIKENIYRQFSDLNREQRRNSVKQIKNESENAKKANDKQYDDVVTIIRAFRSLIPYNRMLISHDGYLIPLDDNFFRINPSNLGFKYGGEMTCVGMVTNIIGESTEPNDSNNPFATIQYVANEALRKLLPTTQNDLCVLHPIAVYYGR